MQEKKSSEHAMRDAQRGDADDSAGARPAPARTLSAASSVPTNIARARRWAWFDETLVLPSLPASGPG